MKKASWLWGLFGFAFTVLCGTVLHFLYGWLNDSAFIAPFSAVNESTFEHMKILFWPMLLFAVIQSFFFREKSDFWCVKLHSILIGIFLIPLLFYTYNGAIGSSPAWLNIAFFFISAAAAYTYEVLIFKSNKGTCKNPKLASIVLYIIMLSFILFTFAAPKIELFRDPITGSYGI